MQPGLKTLPALALVLGLTLGLAACGRTGPAEGTAPGAEPSPAGLATDAIEVTPLDAAQPGAPESAAGTPSEAPPAEAVASPPPTVLVQAADAGTPHPKPRPSDAGADAAAPAPDALPPEPPKSQSQLLCEASGGVWGQMPDNGAYLCQKKTRDGGKQCRAKGDCQGECLAPSGTCAPVMPLLGCNDILDNQGRRMTLCLD